MGLTPRITRVRDDFMPYEALSFPAFRYHPLLEETWEDSDFSLGSSTCSSYQFMADEEHAAEGLHARSASLLAPQRRGARPHPAGVGEFRVEIREGKADHLTPASETIAIHVRPHGRDHETRTTLRSSVRS